MIKPAFRWEVPGASQVCQGQWISFPAIMKTSRGLHKVAQEQVQRISAAKGSLVLQALHFTLAQVFSGR